MLNWAVCGWGICASPPWTLLAPIQECMCMCDGYVDCDGPVNPVVEGGIVQSLFGTCDAPRAACP